MKFYRCKKCGKAVAVLGESGEDMFCRNAELMVNITKEPIMTPDGLAVPPKQTAIRIFIARLLLQVA